jgi:4-amino-4-deoxy-L-arabinose transferase-like glycosyltransferase
MYSKFNRYWDYICSQKVWTKLSYVFCLSLTARLIAYCLLPEPILSTNAKLAYIGGAEILLQGAGFGDPSIPVFTPPLYTILIAINLSLFGDTIFPIKLAQIITDALTTILLYRLVKRFFADSIALLTSIFWAIYPFAIYSTLYIGPETIFTFIMVVHVTLLVSAIRLSRFKVSLSAGSILGLATLTRGTTQFFPVIVPLFFLLSCRRFNKRVMLNSVSVIVSFAVVICPWAIRNYYVLGEIIPVANASGVLLFGSSERLWTIENRDAELEKYYKDLASRGLTMPPPGSSFKEKDSFQLKAAMENYRIKWEASPREAILFLLQKVLRVWYATESGSNHGIILLVNIPVYAVGLFGLIHTSFRNNHLAIIAIVLIGYFVTLHAIALPLFRYILPVMPYILMFAAIGVHSFSILTGDSSRTAH